MLHDLRSIDPGLLLNASGRVMTTNRGDKELVLAGDGRLRSRKAHNDW